MIPTRENLLEKASEVLGSPVAIEASWDGDTTGWFVMLTLLYVEQADGSRYQTFDLAEMRGTDGDLRIFNGQVPPWPEAAPAKQVGEELSVALGVPFFFASPNQPEDDCPRWWERHKASPCRRCGTLLLQPETCAWRGVCYLCNLAESRAAAPAGLRCEICGNPAGEATSSGTRLCAECARQYSETFCSVCGVRILDDASDKFTKCHICGMRERIARLSELDRDAIRSAANVGGILGIKAVRDRLGWTISEAQLALQVIVDFR